MASMDSPTDPLVLIASRIEAATKNYALVCGIVSESDKKEWREKFAQENKKFCRKFREILKMKGPEPPKVHPILLGLTIVMKQDEDLINISASHPDMPTKHSFYPYRMKDPPDLSHLLPPLAERWWEHITPVLPPASPHSPLAAPLSPLAAQRSPPASPHSPLAAPHSPLAAPRSPPAAPHSPPAARRPLSAASHSSAAPNSPPAASRFPPVSPHYPPAAAGCFSHAPGPAESDGDAHMGDGTMSEEKDELDDDSDTQQLALPKRPKRRRRPAAKAVDIPDGELVQRDRLPVGPDHDPSAASFASPAAGGVAGAKRRGAHPPPRKKPRTDDPHRRSETSEGVNSAPGPGPSSTEYKFTCQRCVDDGETCQPSSIGSCARCRKRKYRCTLVPRHKETGKADRSKKSPEEVLRIRLEQQEVAANVLDEGQDAPRPVPLPMSDPVDLPLGMLTLDAASASASGGIADVIPFAADVGDASRVAADIADTSHIAADIANVVNTAANAWAEGHTFHAEVSTHVSNSCSSTATYGPHLPFHTVASAPHASTPSPSVTTHPTSAQSAGLKCYSSILHPEPTGVIASCHTGPLLVPVHAPSPPSNALQESNGDNTQNSMVLDRLDGLEAMMAKMAMQMTQLLQNQCRL